MNDTKKEIINSNRQSWRQVLGNPPSSRNFKEWILFQKSKWQWQWTKNGKFQQMTKEKPKMKNKTMTKKNVSNPPKKTVSKSSKNENNNLTFKFSINQKLQHENVSEFEAIRLKNIAEREKQFKDLFPNEDDLFTTVNDN